MLAFGYRSLRNSSRSPAIRQTTSFFQAVTPHSTRYTWFQSSKPYTMASETLPSSMKALTLSDGVSSIQSIALPPLRPTYLLIKVHSVALNPTDCKSQIVSVC